MTKEDMKASIAALLEERRGYEVRKAIASEKKQNDDPVVAAAGAAELESLEGRLSDVAEQLKALGHAAAKPSSRASRRPARASAAKR